MLLLPIVLQVNARCTERECSQIADWLQYTYIPVIPQTRRAACFADYRTHSIYFVDDCEVKSCFECKKQRKSCGVQDCGGPSVSTCMPPTQSHRHYHCECRPGYTLDEEKNVCSWE